MFVIQHARTGLFYHPCRGKLRQWKWVDLAYAWRFRTEQNAMEQARQVAARGDAVRVMVG